MTRFAPGGREPRGRHGAKCEEPSMWMQCVRSALCIGVSVGGWVCHCHGSCTVKNTGWLLLRPVDTYVTINRMYKR